jgi:hypothetical protein
MQKYLISLKLLGMFIQPSMSIFDISVVETIRPRETEAGEKKTDEFLRALAMRGRRHVHVGLADEVVYQWLMVVFRSGGGWCLM